MTTKSQVLATDNNCLANAEDDEPVFILRAQDKLAPALIRAWASLAREHGCSGIKINKALQVADAMDNWSQRKFPD